MSEDVSDIERVIWLITLRFLNCYQGILEIHSRILKTHRLWRKCDDWSLLLLLSLLIFLLLRLILLLLVSWSLKIFVYLHLLLLQFFNGLIFILTHFLLHVLKGITSLCENEALVFSICYWFLVSWLSESESLVKDIRRVVILKSFLWDLLIKAESCLSHIVPKLWEMLKSIWGFLEASECLLVPLNL